MIGRSFKWVAPHGGPYLLLPREALSGWNPMARHPGVLAGDDRPSRKQTNYWQVCEMALQNEVGAVEVGECSGVVFGGVDIPMATFLPHDDGSHGHVDSVGDIVVALEWDGDATDEGIRQGLRELSQGDFRTENVTILAGEQGLVLFAAHDAPPDWTCDHVDCFLRPGRYQIATAQCEAGDYVVFRVHPLLPISG